MKPADDKPQGLPFCRVCGAREWEACFYHTLKSGCPHCVPMVYARSSVATNEADIYADGFAAGLEAAAVEVSGHWNVTGLRCDQKEQAERSAAVIRRLPIARSSRSATAPHLTPVEVDELIAFNKRVAHNHMLADDFNGEEQFKRRAEEIERKRSSYVEREGKS